MRYVRSPEAMSVSSKRLLNIGLLFCSVALTGCAGTRLPVSVSESECKIFERPPYQIKGATQYDQDWADGNTEAGVGGCAWQRPLPRPPELDAQATRSKVLTAAKPATPKKKPGIFKRSVERVLHRRQEPPVAPVVGPVIELPEIIVAPAPPPVAAPPPPQSALDALLFPRR